LLFFTTLPSQDWFKVAFLSVLEVSPSKLSKLQAKDREQGSESWPKHGYEWSFQDEMTSGSLLAVSHVALLQDLSKSCFLNILGVSPLKLQAKDREQGSGSWPKQGSG
jgi:hypothetical protein